MEVGVPKTEDARLAEALSGLLNSGALKRPWSSLWDAFLSDAYHRAWWDRHRHQPQYCLPAEFIDTLAKESPSTVAASRRRSGRRTRSVSRRALLLEDVVHTERAFTMTCRTYDAACVGVWDGHPIIHSLLGPACTTDTLADDFIMSFDSIWLRGTLRQRRAKLRSIEAVAARTHRIRLQRVGQLSTHRAFLQEARDLKTAWGQLACQPPFPLDRRIRTTAPADLPKQTPDFQLALIGFMDRWELLELTTWDLPVPLGPLTSLPVRVELNGMGHISITNVFPSYWPVPERLDETAARLTIGAANSSPLKSLALRNEPGLYERAYEMRIAELGFTRRHGSRHGYVNRLLEAFEIRFRASGGGRLSPERVKQIRDAYAPNLSRA